MMSNDMKPLPSKAERRFKKDLTSRISRLTMYPRIEHNSRKKIWTHSEA